MGIQRRPIATLVLRVLLFAVSAFAVSEFLYSLVGSFSKIDINLHITKIEIYTTNPFTAPDTSLVLWVQFFTAISYIAGYYASTQWEVVLRLFDLAYYLRPPEPKVEGPTGLRALISDIEQRIASLQRRANLIIAIVVIALCFAVILIIFAGRLTSIDAAAVSNISTIRDEIASVDRRILDLNERLGRLYPKTAAPAAASAPSDPAVPPPVEVIEGIKIERAYQYDRRTSTAKLLEKAWQQELEETTKDKLKDTNFITATFLTRIGVLVILIFLVQILISLYKYNTRMVAFYASRLDTLRLSSEALDKMQDILMLMTPTAVDFGPEPKHPIFTLLSSWQKTKLAEKNRSTKPASKAASGRESVHPQQEKAPSQPQA